MDDDKSRQRRGRIVIVIFIGGAILLAITTIVGTYSTLGEPAAPVSAAAATPTS